MQCSVFSVPVDSSLLDVSEDFLDPITCEIMTQPVILPSGKIIDQKTLEKHGQNESVWGRPVSDPFTGIAFSEVRKPIAAFPLKARIDKFLLENSNHEEIKKLPRVLGSRLTHSSTNVNVISCVPAILVNNVDSSRSNVNSLKRTLTREETNSGAKKSFRGHSLPLVSYRNVRVAESAPKSTVRSATLSREEIQKRNNAIEARLNSQIQVTSAPSCECCTEKIFYKLPCEHVICRKALLSLEKNECIVCKIEFKTSDPQRFHLST